MAEHHDKLAKLLTTQQSLTEWLEDIKHDNTDSLKVEDNDKRERLQVLRRLIDLPCEGLVKFTGKDLADRSDALVAYLNEHGDELCALRLIPLEAGLPKLRMRGKTVSAAYEWFKEQNIAPEKYRADYIEHPPDNTWATIFIVGPNGIFGEIIWGGHQQLTQGFHDSKRPIVFTYDFKELKLSEENEELQEYLMKLLDFIKVDEDKQQSIKDELGGTFSNNYLNGYFETADASIGLWFIDYNQSLGKLYANVDIEALLKDHDSDEVLVKGMKASAGTATGKVQIVAPEDVESVEFAEGNVLVCSMTSPDYLPLMQLASAVVTDQGGILSHAAIVAREMKKPCIVGTGDATSKLENDQNIVVDGDAGVVRSA